MRSASLNDGVKRSNEAKITDDEALSAERTRCDVPCACVPTRRRVRGDAALKGAFPIRKRVEARRSESQRACLEGPGWRTKARLVAAAAMADEVSLSAVVVNAPAALAAKPIAGGEYECDDVRPARDVRHRAATRLASSAARARALTRAPCTSGRHARHAALADAGGARGEARDAPRGGPAEEPRADHGAGGGAPRAVRPERAHAAQADARDRAVSAQGAAAVLLAPKMALFALRATSCAGGALLAARAASVRRCVERAACARMVAGIARACACRAPARAPLASFLVLPHALRAL